MRPSSKSRAFAMLFLIILGLCALIFAPGPDNTSLVSLHNYRPSRFGRCFVQTIREEQWDDYCLCTIMVAIAAGIDWWIMPTALEHPLKRSTTRIESCNRDARAQGLALRPTSR